MYTNQYNASERFVNKYSDGIIIFGASSGGPKAYKRILPLFPKDYPVSMILVQHMLVGPFIEGFADGLIRSGVDVRIPANNEPILPGKIYMAPSGYQLMIINKTMFLSNEDNKYAFNPAVNPTLISGAECYKEKTIGIILTGLSAFYDGVEGCRAVKKNGGITIAQSEETSAIFGMPKEAIDAGVIDYVVDLEKIPDKIMSLIDTTKGVFKLN